MKITVKIYGYLPSQFPAYDKEKGIVVKVEKHTSVEEVIATLPLDSSDCIAISSDGFVLPKSSRLERSMLIRLFPVAAGG